MYNIAEQQVVVKGEDLNGLSQSNLRKLSLIIAGMALGFLSAESVLAAASAGGPDVVLDAMPQEQYFACHQYWNEARDA